ncbi:MAG: 50S ribosomal protein L4 [Candidatus Collierbacteria bacterium GW2011_GWB1_44_6]|uniref:Large ribosomal subunit protein uL4 n=2 Tax=Candidatus Collieribacteriota TaxID=1752725 RepID=A0A0G1JPE4_9BACT|nr:MAG: 50S ribosomal protein L4 [Candidatus Collierbacteria bacterium GW2011_GWC2_43_12]KKT73235.1 MAG: 50S ribosomal protein L4 [Candidatus Collierbacteria bacterium GW2011_GWB1_44_6]KKT83521.1 MAG: 50S ribosomal protein L4 [Microgenomates group bacterium GW2011_GWC1_44_9]
MATTKKSTPITTAQSDLSVFSLEVKPSLITQAIHVYQENSHRGVSKTKTRGEINATKKKVYKQKGTGNARHGAQSSPIYVGGGVPFGPTGLKSAPKSLNQKMKVRALSGILTIYQKENRLSLVNTSEIKQSTKSAQKVLGKDQASLVFFGENPEVLKAVSNLENISLLSARRLNVFSVAQSPKIYLTNSAYDHLITRLKLK